MAKEAIYTAVDDRQEQSYDLADRIWEHPEVALQETNAVSWLTEQLQDAGFDVKTGIGGMETAFVARYGTETPVVGTMGEYDALPELSQTRTATREPVEEGVPGHGCGHNLFGVGSLGGALAVRDAIADGEVSGSVMYYGTPAEEVGLGKVAMVDAGAFDPVDAIISWHPGWYNAPGKGSSLANDAWTVTFTGESSHAAAAPEAGRSALDGLQLLNTGIEYMREHVSEQTRLHYVINDGGGAANVVPPTATGEYILRAPDRDAVERLSAWFQEAANGAAKMADVDVTVQKAFGVYDLEPNVTLGDVIHDTMQDLGGFEIPAEQQSLATRLKETINTEKAITELPEPHRSAAREEAVFTTPIEALDAGETGAYSTDSGDVSQVVPVGRFTAATWPVGTAPHSWQAVAASGTLGKAGMLFAAKTIGGALYDLPADPALLARAREEFDRATGGREYHSPLPAGVDPETLLNR